jgi:ubiquinone/menaquinone biosynthesis C-methylase UbiE
MYAAGSTSGKDNRSQPMNDAVNSSMRRYYEDRAPEYELIYQGGRPAAGNNPTLFQHDAAAVAKSLPGLAGPVHLDLACGTGYWLQCYHQSCRRITLVDQSAAMLTECRKKANAAGINDKCEFIQADVLLCQLPAAAYDSALLGFLWSHLTPAEEARLFGALRAALRPGGRLLLVDSAWSAERATTNKKSGVQTRTVAGGRNYLVRKRYLDEDELQRMTELYQMTFHTHFSGKAFMSSEGKFHRHAHR